MKHDPKCKGNSLFKHRLPGLAGMGSKKSTFGVKVELGQDQSFKATQRGAHSFRGDLALHQNDEIVIFGYSPKFNAGVQHRRNVRDLEAAWQSPHVAAAG